MGLIEHDHAFELWPCPAHDLVEPAILDPGRAQRPVGNEQDAFRRGDFLADLPAGEVDDVGWQTADCRPVALRVFEERCILRNPDVAAIALEPLVENAGGRLPPLPRPGAVAKEEPGAVELAIRILFQRHLARSLPE